MRAMIEERIETPELDGFDVCVVGGSCTGVFAAVRAAQAGARVALIEANGFFGGVATAGMVNIWHSIYDTEGRQEIIGGLTRLVIDRLKTRDAVSIKEPTDPSHYAIFNPAELTLELDALIRAEPLIRPFLHARFVKPIVGEDGRVTHAVIEDKSGRRAIAAKSFVDASGDGDLVARAGLPTWKGSVLQPPTTGAVFQGLDEVARLNPDFKIENMFDSKYGGGFKHSFMWSSEYVGVPGMRFLAATRANGADSSDADSLTAAEMEGRRQLRVLCDIIRGNFKTEGKFTLAFIAACAGIRESRHCRGEYSLTETDVIEGVRFDDAIANGSYRVDIHHGAGITFKYLDGRSAEYHGGLDGSKPELVPGRWREKRSFDPTFYQIPYRSLVPKGSANVLCAGRIVDADRGAYGAVRVMVNCNQTGEAAGLACAMAADKGIEVGKVDAAALRSALSKAGAIIV